MHIFVIQSIRESIAYPHHDLKAFSFSYKWMHLTTVYNIYTSRSREKSATVAKEIMKQATTYIVKSDEYLRNIFTNIYYLHSCIMSIINTMLAFSVPYEDKKKYICKRDF